MTETTQVLAPPSRGRHQEVWVGVFVIVGVLLTLYLLFTMTDAADFRGRYHIRATVPDAGGIRRGDPVQMRGVNIGRVRTFTLLPDKSVSLRMEIEGEYRIPADSRVTLVSSLLGGMVARVEPGDSPQMAEAEQELTGRSPLAISQQMEEAAGEATKTFQRAQQLLSDKLIQSTESSANELQALLKRWNDISAEQQGQLKTLTASLRDAAKNVQDATSRDEIDRAIKRLDDLSAKADRTAALVEESTKTLNTVLGRIERGEGTLGKMSTDEALYTNLNKTLESVNATSKEMKDLLADLKANPKKYLKVSVF